MCDKKRNLYEQIYEDIKAEILCGILPDGSKLPSKRIQAQRRGVSVITVENAYSQLVAEGYIAARERSGYYVCTGDIPEIPAKAAEEGCTEIPFEPEEPVLTGDSVFPFSVWTRLMRAVISDKGSQLLSPVPAGGAAELQRAISGYLKNVRALNVPPERIIIGAGTEYLNDLLVKLLGRNLTYAVENPGYHKPAQIYRLNNALCLSIGLDRQGMLAEQLYYNNISVAHISPAHHFPTGIVMPVSRRMELIKWASQRNGYIIEDDYDSEFRWSGKPVPAMLGMSSSGRVIYMNTFSMTIAPSVRIGYVCLPPELYERWREQLSFISCPVPAFEQFTLARFIESGHFERHINRMRKHYRKIRENLLTLAQYFCGDISVPDNSGLHLIMEIPDNSPLKKILPECGITISQLSCFYDVDTAIPPEAYEKYVVNFAGADAGRLEKAIEEIE